MKGRNPSYDREAANQGEFGTCSVYSMWRIIVEELNFKYGVVISFNEYVKSVCNTCKAWEGSRAPLNARLITESKIQFHNVSNTKRYILDVSVSKKQDNFDALYEAVKKSGGTPLIYVSVRTKTDGHGLHALAAKRVHPSQNSRTVMCINSWGDTNANYICTKDNFRAFYVVDTIIKGTYNSEGKISNPKCLEGAQELIRDLLDPVSTEPGGGGGSDSGDINENRKRLQKLFKQAKKGSHERLEFRAQMAEIDMKMAKNEKNDLKAIDTLRKTFLALKRLVGKNSDNKNRPKISQSLQVLDKIRCESGRRMGKLARKGLIELKRNLQQIKDKDAKCIRPIEGLGNQLPEGLYERAICFHEAADAFFKLAMIAKEKDDIKNFHYCLEETSNLANKAAHTLTLFTYDSDTSSTRILSAKISDLNDCSSLEKQSAALNEKLVFVLKTIGKDYGTSLSHEQKLLMIDKLKIGIQQCKGKDILAECKAYAYMGILWWHQDEEGTGYTTNKITANGLFHTAIKLEQSMRPASSTMTKWYQETIAFISKYQTILVALSDERLTPEYTKAVASLADELEELKKANAEGVPALLKHIYTKHAPATLKQNKIPTFPISSEKEDFRKILEKAMSRYNPDRASNKARAPGSNQTAPLDQVRYRWHVLVTEISKYLNAAHTKAFYPCAEV